MNMLEEKWNRKKAGALLMHLPFGKLWHKLVAISFLNNFRNIGQFFKLLQCRIPIDFKRIEVKLQFGNLNQTTRLICSNLVKITNIWVKDYKAVVSTNFLKKVVDSWCYLLVLKPNFSGRNIRHSVSILNCWMGLLIIITFLWK